jgi:hypothetical protein
MVVIIKKYIKLILTIMIFSSVFMIMPHDSIAEPHEDEGEF